MKKIFWIFLIILTSCSDKNKELIIDYVNSCNQHNLKNFKDFLSDSVKCYYADEVYNKDTLIKNFFNSQDSLLKYSTEIISIKKKNDENYYVHEKITDMYSRTFPELKALERNVLFQIHNNKIILIKTDSIMNASDFASLRLILSKEFGVWVIANMKIKSIKDEDFKDYEELLKKFALTFSLKNYLNEKETFIEFLKKYHDPEISSTITMKDVFNKIAGIEGSISYSFYHSEKYPDNKNIGVVEVFIDKKKRDKFRTFKLQYQINLQNEFVELSYGEIDEKPKSVMEIGMTLNLLEQFGLLEN